MKTYLLFTDTNAGFRLRNVISVEKGEARRFYRQYSTKAFEIKNGDLARLKQLVNDNAREFLFNKDVRVAEIRETTIPAGYFYPRVYRPVPFDYLKDVPFLDTNFMSFRNGHVIHLRDELLPPIDQEHFSDSMNQIGYLVEHLNQIFRVVHPSEANIRAFGIEIRNLIILTCTEIEAQWLGILKANGYEKDKGNYTTNDYVKLLELLRLTSYSLRFRRYPMLEALEPYKDWNPEHPTKSLSWYHAYNKIKHNRKGEMDKASLMNLLLSIAGLAVILVAQYGPEILTVKEFQGLFEIVNEPQWGLIEAYLIPESFSPEDWQVLEWFGK